MSILGDCAVIIQAQGPAICVCRAGSLVINDLRVTGTRGLALLVQDDVTIKGTLDVAATDETGGPGGEPAPVKDAGLFMHGTADLIPLRGGAAAMDGSAGGGALQISAGASISIDPSGTIQAGGGGGRGQVYAGRAAGSGGGILLEAPIVKLEGQLLANGGGGGGGGDREVGGGHGQDARDAGRTPAYGGLSKEGRGCALRGYTEGGRGGSGGIEGRLPEYGELGDLRNCIPPVYVEAGGAGGGVGRIRINAASPASIQKALSAHISPAASTDLVIVQ